MSDKEKEKESSREVDLRQMMSSLLRKSWLIILVSVLCAVVTFAGTYYFVAPKYDAAAMFYVNNSSVLGDINISDVLTTSDLNARKSLVDTYSVILESRETLKMVKDKAGSTRSVGELRNMISAASVNGTEIFQVKVTSTDPKEAENIANAIVDVLPARIGEVVENASASVVDRPVLPTGPSSPSYSRNALLGFLVGFVLCAGVLLLRELFDVVIRVEEDVQNCCNHPVLAAVPDMLNANKGGYYYRDSKSRTGALTGDKKPVLIGSGISFAASEAYKLLRTKLQFSFVDGHDCHIIGVSSALAGEGKSLSSVNLAHSLAQLDKRVLLIDCDMRRPSLNAKLPIQKTPGLSNYLTRQVDKQDVIQKYATEDCHFDVVSSGRNPPNPIELLSSERMQNMLDELRSSYEYIILDLPPVGEVSDALVAAKLVDGVLLVVRQNYCDRNALADAVSQFKFVDARILGVVLNCTSDESARYGKRYYKGYRRYYSRYQGSYASRGAKAEKEQ
ncbi:MAG: polysaccharide biosynthesis tyrosine autokinase [Oscillospiraceae bacterium]|nr:polysaccharide biosynthesis tyrosine autokinase [Oscillospiraceae bacterium]